MKYIFLFAIAMTALTACDPELNHYYSVENNTENEITVLDAVHVWDDEADPSNVFSVTVIQPGEMIDVAYFGGIGTTKNIKDADIQLETLVIINADSLEYNKDWMDSSLWDISKEGRHNGYFNLQVNEEDF